MKAFQVELKVCEACGVLWLRAASQGIYCRRCVAWLSDFPAPRNRGARTGNRRGRKPLVRHATETGLRVVYARGTDPVRSGSAG